MNEIRTRRRAFTDLLRIKGDSGFHRYLITDAVNRYKWHCGNTLGSVLAVCADAKEATVFPEFNFDRVTLSSIIPADETTRKLLAVDKRFSWEIQNAEALPYASRSFDLVFCKEGLHHLARPFLGLYEMLRVCQRAVIVIEPYDTLAGRFLERLGLSSVYETNQHRNLRRRDNYVFRFSRRGLESVLSSYYVRSGYRLELTLGWSSVKVNLHPSRLVRLGGTFMGWVLSFTPGSAGNYMSALILPGKDLPSDLLPAKEVIVPTHA
jgi:hypothetical protein